MAKKKYIAAGVFLFEDFYFFTCCTEVELIYRFRSKKIRKRLMVQFDEPVSRLEAALQMKQMESFQSEDLQRFLESVISKNK